MSSAIAVSELTVRYGDVLAADGVSFAIDAGEVVGLLGPNGAGKTTIIKAALGLLVPDSGSIRVDGVDVHRRTDRAYRHVSAMLEGARNVYWRLTVRENVAFFASLQGIDPRARRDEHDRLLASLDLLERAGDPVNDLSRGMKQKVALACVLARETPVVFLDEPTLGLDVEASYALRERIRRLANEEGRTVVLSSHDMDAVQATCDRVVVVNGGRVVADDRVADLVDLFRAQAYRVTLAERVPNGLRPRLEHAFAVEEWRETDGRTTFLVTLGDTEAFYAFVEALKKSEARLAGLSAVEPDLEDVFIHLTEGER